MKDQYGPQPSYHSARNFCNWMSGIGAKETLATDIPTQQYSETVKGQSIMILNSVYKADRSLARFIILSRSSISAFRLSLSSSGGMALNAASIAISFASARLTFKFRNSCSILSSVRLDNSFSKLMCVRHYRRSTYKKGDLVSALIS